MSIILKGIDMPKEGEHIVALIKSNGKCSYWEQDTEYGICEPMQTVEAIQIPTPHGRLIDGDKLRATLRRWTEDEWNQKASPVSWAYAYEDLIDLIDDAQTILEAEE